MENLKNYSDPIVTTEWLNKMSLQRAVEDFTQHMMIL